MELPVLVEDEVDLLSEVDDVSKDDFSEEEAGLAPSPEDFRA